MSRNRIASIAGLFGVGVAIVTFLAAAKTTSTTERAAEPSALQKEATRGVVFFGNVDTDVRSQGILPDNFPQPSRVVDFFVVEGQEVEKDQPLYQLDATLAEAKVREAEAGVKRAESAVARYRKMVETAKQAKALELAAIEVGRLTLESKKIELDGAAAKIDNLKEKINSIGVKNDPELKAATYSYNSSVKAWEAERAKLDAAEKNLQTPLKVAEAEAAVAEAEAAVVQQQALVDQAVYGRNILTVKAPLKGKIVRSELAKGVTFGPQTRTPPVVLQPQGALIVRAEVDQDYASRVAKGQLATVHDVVNASIHWKGKVTAVAETFLPKRAATAADALLASDTKVLECIISVETPPGMMPLRVGQKVNVKIGVD